MVVLEQAAVGMVGVSVRGEGLATSRSRSMVTGWPSAQLLQVSRACDSLLGGVERVTSMVAAGGHVVAVQVLRRLVALSTSLVVVADRRRRSLLGALEILRSAFHSSFSDVNVAAGVAPVSTPRRVESILRCGEVAARPVDSQLASARASRSAAVAASTARSLRSAATTASM